MNRKIIKKQLANIAGIGLILILSSSITKVQAQYLSLDNNELGKLKSLINSNSDVKKSYERWVNLADLALKQEPNPVDTIVSEGHLATDPRKIRTQKSLADLYKMYALAFSYKVSNQPIYFTKCVAYLVSWAKVNRGSGNPINDTKLDPLLEAYDLIKTEMGNSDRAVVDNWLSQVAKAEIERSGFKKPKQTAYNNWNSHRIKIIGNIAYLLNNQEYKLFVDTTIKTQILKNLYADGSGMDFEERDALHYHIYTLEPLLKIAVVIKRANGENYFVYQSPSGSSIERSTEFLVPFARGKKVHHEFVNSKVPFDQKRADNKEPGYTIGANFKPKSAIDVFSYAAYFNPVYADIVKQLIAPDALYSNWQSVLNAVKK